jgi:hypothetical protein
MYKMTGFCVCLVGVKDVYCLVVVLCLKVKFTYELFHCGDANFSVYHVSRMNSVGKYLCPMVVMCRRT